VTNAVKHGAASGSSAIRVDGVMFGQWLEIEVTNVGRPLEHALRLPPETATHGRGLVIVDALASRWGSRHERGMTTVWFELETDAEPEPERPVLLRAA
jgi:hypothetical protein